MLRKLFRFILDTSGKSLKQIQYIVNTGDKRLKLLNVLFADKKIAQMKVSFRFIIVLTFLNLSIKSQTCETPQSVNTINSAGCVSCNSFTDFIPDQIKDSIMFIKLNIYFTLPTSGYQGPFANVVSADADNLIYGLNVIADSLYSANLKVYPAPQYIKRPRFRFKLNSYQKFADNNIYYGPDVSYPHAVVPPSYFNNETAFNVIFNVDTNTWAGHPVGGGYGVAAGIPSTYLSVRSNINASQTFVWWQNTGLLFHEIGHCLGLVHTNTSQSCVTDYKIETTEWNQAGGACSNDTTRSNNILGYNFNCRVYFSPLQLATIYKNVKTLYNKRIVITPNNYIIGTNPNFNYDVTTNETWTINRYFKGNITVKTGRTLTVKCQLAMPQNAKIKVEKGAKLLIDGGEITNIFGKLWKGIEIDGTSNQNQNFSGGYAIYQGIVEMINSAKLSNAQNAIRTGTTDLNGNLDWGSTGGVIHATSSTFENNIRDVEFLYYTLSNKSFFEKCNFQITDSIKEQQPLIGRVSLYEVRDVRFKGCTFAYNVGNYYPVGSRGYGIYSIDATYFVDQICNTPFTPCGSYTKTRIQDFDYGIRADNSNPLRVVSVQNSEIYRNNIEGVRFSIMNSAIFEKNDIIVSNIANATGLYLNVCKLYNVRNNSFTSSGVTTQTGIYVNGSATGAHLIYRNTFSNLFLGIAPMFDNSGQTCNSQNKFLISAGTKQVLHPSYTFTGMQPLPQPSCSNALVVVSTAAGSYNSTQCPEIPGGGGGGGGARFANSDPINIDNNGDSNSAKQKNEIEDFELQRKYSEKLNSFLLDSSPASLDSVINLLLVNAGNLPDAEELLVYAYLNKSDFINAGITINNLKNKNFAPNNDVTDFQGYLMQIKQSSNKTNALKVNGSFKNSIENLASNTSKKGSLNAKCLLQYANNTPLVVEKLLPDNYLSNQETITSDNEVNLNDSNLKIYPNPNTGSFTLLFKDDNVNDIEIKVNDLLGKEIFTKFIKANIPYSIDQNLIEGVYFIKAFKNGVFMQQTKIVIIK
jgi:hypothetical protein